MDHILAHPEINNLDLPVLLVYHDVLGLEVSVADSLLVHVRYRLEQLLEYPVESLSHSWCTS